MAKKSNAHKISKSNYKHFVRRYVRRKPCARLVIANFLLFFFLMAILGIVIVVVIKTWTELERYAREEQILEKMSENEKVTLNYCRYESATAWFSNLCGESCGQMSTAWRRFRLDPKETDISCVSRMEQIDCAVLLEANGVKKTCLPELRTVIPECSGTYQHYLKGIGAIDNAWPKLVMAPRVTNEQLEELEDPETKLVEANQLVIHCPICKPQSNFFKYHRISTFFSTILGIIIKRAHNHAYESLQRWSKDGLKLTCKSFYRQQLSQCFMYCNIIQEKTWGGHNQLYTNRSGL